MSKKEAHCEYCGRFLAKLNKDGTFDINGKARILGDFEIDLKNKKINVVGIAMADCRLIHCRIKSWRDWLMRLFAGRNEIELLQRDLKRMYPKLQIEIDRPVRPKGFWVMNICLPDKLIGVEWRPERGFGLWCGEKLYGEGVDEIVKDRKDALKRLCGRIRDEALKGTPNE